jgi:hypothetical protein
MSESRQEHVRNNLALLGKLYSRHIDEHPPETVRPSYSVRSRCVTVGRTKTVKISKAVIRRAAQEMSNISDWVDEMKVKVAARSKE